MATTNILFFLRILAKLLKQKLFSRKSFVTAVANTDKEKPSKKPKMDLQLI